MRIVFTTVALACLLQPAAADCVDYARMGHIFGVVDSQCEAYRLTQLGKRKMVEIASRVAGSGGGERCTTEGKLAMLRDLSEDNPQIEERARRGDEKALNAAVCDAAFKRLDGIGRRNSEAYAERR